MKKTFLLSVFSFLIFTFSVQAQKPTDYYSSRLDNLSADLKRQTVDLVDRTYADLRRNYSNTRADIEAAFLAQQLDASARLFQDLLRENRPATELRDAAAIVSDLARRAPGYGSNSYLWRNAQSTVADINRELGGYSGGNTGGTPTPQSPVIGRAYWRGIVDNEVHLAVKGNEIETRTVSGVNYGSGTFSFTTPFPRQEVTVEAVKKKGRGSVRILQQPSKENRNTAVIQIFDNDRGAKEYEIEIIWRKKAD